MAFASYYSFPPLSFQLNSLYEGDPFQLKGGDFVVSRLDFGLGGVVQGGVLV